MDNDQEPKKQRKPRFSKCVVALVIALNIIFTAAVLTVFCITGNEPTELVIAWFSFTTVELWQVAKIRRDKIKGEKQENDKHNNAE